MNKSYSNVVIIVTLIATLGVTVLVYFDSLNTKKDADNFKDRINALEIKNKELNEKLENKTEINNNPNQDNDIISKENLEKEIQDRYEVIYNSIDEGTNITLNESKTFIINGNEYSYNKVDYTKLKELFTDDGIKYLEENYLYNDGGIYYDSEELIHSIFGITNQGKRDLEIVLYDDNLVLAKAKITTPQNQFSSGSYGGEYILFKKVNNIWKVEIFE